MLIRNKIRGVTLVELMIAIVIFGLLMAMGVPTYHNWLHNSQIRTAARSINNGLQLARAEAVRRNTAVQFKLTALPMSDWTVSLSGGASVIQTRSSKEGSNTARVATRPPILPSVPGTTTTTVTFNGLGQVIANNPSSDPTLTEVDVTSSAAGATRQLNILIGTGTTGNTSGKVRMCDPALTTSAANPNPQSCSY